MEFTYEHTGKFLFHAHKVEFSEKGWVGVFLVKDSGTGEEEEEEEEEEEDGGGSDGDYNDGGNGDGYADTGESSGAAGEQARDVTGPAAAYDGREAPDGA